MDGAVTAVEFGGRRFYCPHADLVPRHTGDERERLDENGGFVYPVLLYRDTTLGLDDCVLDGHGRLGSASRTGAAVEFKHLGDMTTEEARTLAEHLEDDRRHETQDVVRARRERRVRRVAELRAAGMSTRAIAAEVGVSQPQVIADIREATDKGLSVEPERVTGLDGKSRPASKPKVDPPDVDEWDSWEPEEGESLPESATEFDAPAEEAEQDGEAPPPQDETPPQPSHDASRPHRTNWLVPGGKPVDPDHPFCDVLKKFTALSAALTRVLRGEHGKHLVDALVEVGTHPHRVPLVAFTSDVIDGLEVRRGTVRFVGLYALRCLVNDVGNWKRDRKPGQALAAFKRHATEAEQVVGEGEE